MNEYLYLIRPTRLEMLIESTPEEDPIVGQHFLWLKQLAEQGAVLLAGRTLNTDATTFGIVIFRAESDAAAQELMHDDPAVRQRVMRAELYPYRVALLSETYRRRLSAAGPIE
jgi:uncharacterized protein YciI